MMPGVLVTDRGAEIPLFAQGWGPKAILEFVLEVDGLPEVTPESRRV